MCRDAQPAKSVPGNKSYERNKIVYTGSTTSLRRRGDHSLNINPRRNNKRKPQLPAVHYKITIFFVHSSPHVLCQEENKSGNQAQVPIDDNLNATWSVLYGNILRTPAVSSTYFWSILIFASWVDIGHQTSNNQRFKLLTLLLYLRLL